MSSRYLLAICALVAAALVPTFIHSYGGQPDGAGRQTQVIPPSLAGYESGPSGRNERWGANRFSSDDWIERNYKTATDEVRLTVVRSYDLKALYHHPELAVAYGPKFGSSFEKYEVKRFAQRPDIPVHVLYPAPTAQAVAMYVLLYEDEFVERPLFFHLRIAGELLFSRRKPMTLFFVHDLVAERTTAVERLASAGLLFASVDAFRTKGTVGTASAAQLTR